MNILKPRAVFNTINHQFLNNTHYYTTRSMNTATDEPYRFQARLVGENFVELPVKQLRRIANASGVDSIEQETKHFSCEPFHSIAS